MREEQKRRGQICRQELERHGEAYDGNDDDGRRVDSKRIDDQPRIKRGGRRYESRIKAGFRTVGRTDGWLLFSPSS